MDSTTRNAVRTSLSGGAAHRGVQVVMCHCGSDVMLWGHLTSPSKVPQGGLKFSRTTSNTSSELVWEVLV